MELIGEFEKKINPGENGEDLGRLKIAGENGESAYFNSSLITLLAKESKNITLFVKTNFRIGNGLIEIYAISKNGKIAEVFQKKKKMIGGVNGRKKQNIKYIFQKIRMVKR